MNHKSVFDSAFGSAESWRGITNVSRAKNVVASHDITSVLNASQTHTSRGFAYNSTLFGGDIPVKVVRSVRARPGWLSALSVP